MGRVWRKYQLKPKFLNGLLSFRMKLSEKKSNFEFFHLLKNKKVLIRGFFFNGGCDIFF